MVQLTSPYDQPATEEHHLFAAESLAKDESGLDTQIQTLGSAVDRLTVLVNTLLELQRRPLGFRPDKLRATQIQVRRNRLLGPQNCLQIWDPQAKQATPCPTHTLSLLLTNLRCVQTRGGDREWDEMRLSGSAGARMGPVDLIITLGGLTSDAVLASLLSLPEEELKLPVIFSFSPADQSETVVLVRVSNHRNEWIDPSAQRQKWGRNSRGMLEALQERLRRALGVTELPYEGHIRAGLRP